MSNLKIATFNCQHFDGVLKEKVCKELMDEFDFLLLQEHWLYEENFHKFDKISRGYTICKHGKSSMDPSVIRVGRPYGGSVILWKGTINLNVNPVKTLSCRLNCINVISRVTCLPRTQFYPKFRIVFKILLPILARIQWNFHFKLLRLSSFIS